MAELSLQVHCSLTHATVTNTKATRHGCIVSAELFRQAHVTDTLLLRCSSRRQGLTSKVPSFATGPTLTAKDLCHQNTVQSEAQDRLGWTCSTSPAGPQPWSWPPQKRSRKGFRETRQTCQGPACRLSIL